MSDSSCSHHRLHIWIYEILIPGCPNCPYDIMSQLPIWHHTGVSSHPPPWIWFCPSVNFIFLGEYPALRKIWWKTAQKRHSTLFLQTFLCRNTHLSPPPLPGPAPAPIQTRSPHPALPLPARLGLALSATCNRSFASVPFFFRTYRFLYLAMLVLLIFSSLEGKTR